MRIKIADFVFEINNIYPYSEKFVTDYYTDEAPDYYINIDEDFLKSRQAQYPDKPLFYIEFLEIYRIICDFIVSRDGILMHGAVITFDDNAYMFTAPSGTGKTTHIKLWRRLYGSRVGIVNGDKPIIRCVDGVFYAYGTPWCGKEHFNRNIKAPLKGIVLLSRADENYIESVSADKFNPFLLKQVYMPKASEGIIKALDFADKLFSSVPLYHMGCNMSTDAAKVACEALTQHIH